MQACKENGTNSAFSPSTPSAASLLGAGLVAGALLPLDKGAVASPRRTASKDSKGIPEGNMSSVGAQARPHQAQQLCPWHLSCPWPEQRADGASTKRDGGLETATHSGWTHGPSFWDVETEPGGPCLVSEHPLCTSIHWTWAPLIEGAELLYIFVSR